MRLGLAVAAVLVLAGCLDNPAFDQRLPDKATYLLADRFPVLNLDVWYVDGQEPSTFVLDETRAEILRATGRTTIAMEPPQSLGRIAAGEDDRWSNDELERLFSAIQPSDTTTISIAFIDGQGYEGATHDVWGQAFGNFALVFAEKMGQRWIASINDENLTAPRLNLEEVERAVVIHEVGHVLGLVDNGVPRRHGGIYSDQCACHSNDQASVMYPRANGDENALFLAGMGDADIVYRFSDDDLADIRDFQAEYGFRP